VALIALGAALMSADGFLPAVLAADRDISAVAPLERANPYFLDKAIGIGPRFKFFSAPHGLSVACALSVNAEVNDGDFVAYPGNEPSTAEGFRSRAARHVQFNQAEAARAPVHTAFALGGEGPISGAICTNLKAGPEARGHCSGTITGNEYTIVYRFDPVPCGYDNVAAGRGLIAHLSIGSRVERELERNFATRLEQIVYQKEYLLEEKAPHNPQCIHIFY